MAGRRENPASVGCPPSPVPLLGQDSICVCRSGDHSKATTIHFVSAPARMPGPFSRAEQLATGHSRHFFVNIFLTWMCIKGSVSFFLSVFTTEMGLLRNAFLLSRVHSLGVAGVGVCAPRLGCFLAGETVVGCVDGRRGREAVRGGCLGAGWCGAGGRRWLAAA